MISSFVTQNVVCTRKCGFCNVKSGNPNAIDLFEPRRIANAISKLNLISQYNFLHRVVALCKKF